MSLASYGYDARVESLFDPHTSAGLEPGRVVRVDRGRLLVGISDGEIGAVVAGRLDDHSEPGPAAVGDWVAIDRFADTCVVRAILPRTSALTRRAAGGDRQSQVLAANVDLVLVVEPVDRGPNPRRIERAAALAWDAGATPVVLVAKIDLAADREQPLAVADGAAPFADVLPVSAEAGTGLDELRRRLGADRTAVLLGPSGAGKSTLANALLGDARLATATVRDIDHRGRHTTTRRELIALPSGGCLIDTPGVRELGLWLAADAVDGAFPEIEALAAGCRFTDCRHSSEPGCAVIAAVERGELDAARLASYLRLHREAERLELTLDPLGRAELRARARVFARLCRAEVRRKKLR